MRHTPPNWCGVRGAVPAAGMLGSNHKHVVAKGINVKLFSVSRKKVTFCAYTRSFISEQHQTKLKMLC